MAFHGERFEVNLDSDGQDIVTATSSTLAIPGVIGEIQERSPAAPPAPPTLKSASGFPAHKRRAKPSAFKQRQAQPKAPDTGSEKASSDPQDEKAGIDEQNRQQLASMSDAQIQQEREELMSTIDSSLLERFLRRARIDDENPTPFSSTAKHTDDAEPEPASISDIIEEPTPTQQSTSLQTQPPKQKSTPTPDDRQPPTIPADLRPAAEFASSSVHFPTPPPPSSKEPPSLDPNSDSFLSDLQTHYFPNITHDPSSLSWLQQPPSDPDDPESNLPPSSAYHPGSSAESIHPSSIRFSLIGTILSPSTSLSLPTNLGLHHHGDDPHAAGYTIPELAILSRSSFPAQRCISWQVLGRIFFRLGKGQFGERGSNLVEGLWEVIEKEGVVAGMLEEAGGSGPSSSKGKNDAAGTDEKDTSAPATGGAKSGGVGRHASAAAWAVEGVWLWQMGGSGDRGILKPGAVRSQ
ncbi:RPAP1-like protein [Aspergillus venezuelensis]